jgi:hypothetical protein
MSCWPDQGTSVLDSFKPSLHDRLADGERNATVFGC